MRQKIKGRPMIRELLPIYSNKFHRRRWLLLFSSNNAKNKEKTKKTRVTINNT